jgi:formylglycine-generating enzyme required for sulfatase activity
MKICPSKPAGKSSSMRTRILIDLFILALAFFGVMMPSCAAQQAGQPAREDMARIPGGTMEMGIDAADVPRLQKFFNVDGVELFESEMPKHTVVLDDFYLDRHLVTNSQFKKFTDANPQWRFGGVLNNLHNENYLRHWKAAGIPAGKENHPVVNVSWYAAVAYCQWEDKHLPTEAEWAHAARGKLSGPFPWGDKAVDKQRANYGGSGHGTTTAVGDYPPNGYGLFDMAGNVWEFLADEWQLYTTIKQTNPVAGGDRFVTGDAFLRVKSRRVIRGGSYAGDPINLWTEYRDSHPPENAKDFVGFRCAKSDAK